MRAGLWRGEWQRCGNRCASSRGGTEMVTGTCLWCWGLVLLQLHARRDTIHTVCSGLRQGVWPLVNGLDRPVAHCGSGFFWRSAKELDSAGLFHGSHCKHVYMIEVKQIYKAARKVRHALR